jgi:hypothetical protein
VRLAIEDALDVCLPRAFTPGLYQRECAAVFEHIKRATAGRASRCDRKSRGRVAIEQPEAARYRTEVRCIATFLPY